jgi:hypothetical protein
MFSFTNSKNFWALFEELSQENQIRAFKCAEHIRKDGYKDWFQVTGLIYGLRNILNKHPEAHDDNNNNEAVIIGDNNKNGFLDYYNNDIQNLCYILTCGYVNASKDGLHNQSILFNRDEYLYTLLSKNNTFLPLKSMYMIRFRTMYKWHKDGLYLKYENDIDYFMKPFVILFDKYVSASYDTELNKSFEITDEVKNYYKALISKYIGDHIYF